MSLNHDGCLIPSPKIAPSILSADFRKLGEAVKSAERAGADMLHFDIMDGHFVPNISFGPMVVKAVRSETSLPFIVHLMVEWPEAFIDPVVEAGGDLIIFHIEACRYPVRLIESIRERGVKIGVALNPATPLSAVRYVISRVDLILVMTVEPGFGGQKFIPEMMDKIRMLRSNMVRAGMQKDVAVDGGVDFMNASHIIRAGANVLIAGTSVFNQNDVEEAIKRLRRISLEAYHELRSSKGFARLR